MSSYSRIQKQVDYFFRRDYGKVVSLLTAKFGTQYFDSIEDAVQEAMVKALKTWPFSGKPDNQTGWFLRVAHNTLIDEIRKNAVRETKVRSVLQREEALVTDDYFDAAKFDGLELLPMIFSCCHPGLSEESQLVLSLKILCGFGIKEIAQALFKSEAAVARSYTRSKQKFKSLNPQFALPGQAEMEQRVGTVLKVIYLLYNEGYKPTRGNQVMNLDICHEAIYLGELMLKNPQLERPETHALMALMLFQTARFSTRAGAKGELIPLKNQDRSKWDNDLIVRGTYHLNKSADSKFPTDYHIQAGIAYNHCIAPDYDSTDWNQILKLYNIQRAVNPNPVSELNRLVAFAKVEGSDKALEELASSNLQEFFKDYYLLHAIKSELLGESGRVEEAVDALLEALRTVKNDSEKKFIESRLFELNKAQR